MDIAPLMMRFRRKLLDGTKPALKVALPEKVVVPE
jgi:hypothetical protein